MKAKSCQPVEEVRTMTATITVENCAGCPFVMDAIDGEPWLCDALQWVGEPRLLPEQRVPGNRWPDPPDWCPLRTADRLVTLRAK